MVWYGKETDRQNGLGFMYRCVFEETKGGREQVEMVSWPLWHWPAATCMNVSPAIHMGSRVEITLLIRAHMTHCWDHKHGRLSSTLCLLYGQYGGLERCPSLPHPSVSKADGRVDPQVTKVLELSHTSYNTLENGPCTSSDPHNRAKPLGTNTDDLGPK